MNIKWQDEIPHKDDGEILMQYHQFLINDTILQNPVTFKCQFIEYLFTWGLEQNTKDIFP